MSLPKGSSLAILNALHMGARSVSEIVQETGLSQSNVSNHLARMRSAGLVAARRAGKQVFYTVTDFTLAQFVHGRSARATAPSSSALDESRVAEHRTAYLGAVRRRSEVDAMRAVHSAILSGLSWQEVYLRILGPVQEEIGRLWEQGEISVAEEHAATALADRLMSRMVPCLPPPWLARAGSVVVACAEGEQHCLGARMVADIFTASGWLCHYLGGDVPVEDLVRFVVTHRPDLVALSLTCGDGAPALRGAVERIRAWRGDSLRPLLLAGGQALVEAGSDLVRALDLIEQNPSHAVERATQALSAMDRSG
jgi:MerR family transcriptional regulator, light-induced transcriptional regulator